MGVVALEAELRFPLGAAEVEAYHSDGVVGPFRLVSVEVMAAMRERIVDEIVVSGAQLDDPHVDYHDRHLDHETVCRLCRGGAGGPCRLAAGARPADLAQ